MKRPFLIHMLLLSVVLQVSAPPDFSFLADAPIVITRAQRVGAAQQIGQLIDAAVGGDGRACVADRSDGAVICWGSTGAVLWKAGRLGEGPGEFRLLYRIAVMNDGGVVAFDLTLNRLTRFDANGRLVRTFRLSHTFAQVNTMVAVADDALAISGVLHGDAPNAAVHLFTLSTAGATLVRSVGALPPAQNAALYRYWGAGTLARADDGEILYSRRLPYEITTFSAAGNQSSVLLPTLRLPFTVDDVMEIRQQPNGRSFHVLPSAIPIPAMLQVLSPGLLLSNRQVNRSRALYWDFIDRESGATVTVSIPTVAGVGQAFGIDRANGVLWTLGRDEEDQPLIWRFEYRLKGTHGNSNQDWRVE